MSDIIQLLPDHVANQIAAGEVVQRPASVVKELLENSIDASATSIKLILRDAGKTLIQVTDNGKGMSTTDARLSFERHATSKIRAAEDLFQLHTKGFRGEAMASIAAIAHVEMKTKQDSQELGTHIKIEGSKVTYQEMTATPTGTNIAVKNLFYNIPARRNFLKSDTIETRHIIDEFQRVSLSHPEISFSLYHNDNEVYHLKNSNLRKRIVSIFGAKMNEKLVPISEDTEMISMEGFIAKPVFSKKKRGEQFFFVNNRYVKSPYLNHAVVAAFEGLLEHGSHPSYFLYLTVPTKSIDINIIGTANLVKACKLYKIKLIYFSTGYVYEGKKGNYKETDPVKPFNNYGLSKLGGECAVSMYKNSLILRVTMTEKPFAHDAAFTNLKTNFMFHEDLVEILPKIINETGIINIGGKSQSVYNFVKKYNKLVKKTKLNKVSKLPLNQTMSISKLKKYLKW